MHALRDKPVVIHRHNVHYDYILCIWVQTRYAYLYHWEHPPKRGLVIMTLIVGCCITDSPSSFCNDHLRSGLVEFHPQVPMQQGDRAPVRGRHLALLVVATAKRATAAVHCHPVCTSNTTAQFNNPARMRKPSAQVYRI